jgi:hypothetical protein
MQNQNGPIRRLKAFAGCLQMPGQDRGFIDPTVRKETIGSFGIAPIPASQWDRLS